MTVLSLFGGPRDGEQLVSLRLDRSDFENNACINIDGLRYLIGTMCNVGPYGLLVHVHHTDEPARAGDLNRNDL